MPNPEKLAAVATVKQLFEESGAFFVTDYQGLNVSDLTELRKKLRENSVRFLVEKNTLFKIGAAEAGAPDFSEHLNGPTAVAFCTDDPAVAAKILNDSYKDKELPRTKVFVVDGKVYDAADIGRLADLPPKDVLLSQLVSTVEAPFTAVITTLDAFFHQLVGTVDALAEKRTDEGS